MRHIVILFFVCFYLTGCSWVIPWLQNSEEKINAVATKDGVLYDTAFILPEGMGELEQALCGASKLHHLKTNPPKNFKSLYYRCQEDVAELKKFLQTRGYFDAKIKIKMNRKKKPVQIKVIVKLGDAYTISVLQPVVEGDLGEVNLSSEKLSKIMGIHPNDSIDLAKINMGMQLVKRYLRDRGFPFVALPEPVGVLNRLNKTMTLQLNIKLNRHYRFGSTIIIGDEVVTEDFIRNRVSWEEGEVYDRRLVTKTTQKLLETGIFSSVRLFPDPDAEMTKKTDQVPVVIKVKKGPPRTMGLGIRYATTDGIGVKAYWIHRNMRGRGEVLDTAVNIASRDLMGRIVYKIPDFLKKDLTLVNDLTVQQERLKPYKGIVSSYYLGLTHNTTDYITYGFGIEGESSQMRRPNDIIYHYRMLSLPMMISYDTTPDPLNPTKGVRLKLDLVPFIQRTGGKDEKFTMIKAFGATYWRIHKEKLTVAFWGRYGQFMTFNEQKLPIHKRFYAGGANSVRAYGHQLLGPLDVSGRPMGGTQLFEMGIEPRFRLTEKIGGVIFIEGALIKERQSAQKHLYNHAGYGAGVGVRYYTDIGPVRLDIAVPLKKRTINKRKVDSAFQVYISFGHAF